MENSPFENIITLRQRSEHKIRTLGKRAKVGQELLKHLLRTADNER